MLRYDRKRRDEKVNGGQEDCRTDVRCIGTGKRKRRQMKIKITLEKKKKKCRRVKKSKK